MAIAAVLAVAIATARWFSGNMLGLTGRAVTNASRDTAATAPGTR